MTVLPRASIIVLAWNGEKYLNACLQAVLAQTDDTAEVFVVDNASTDQSVAIAQSFAPHVRLIQNETNLGFAGGNNVGIKAASGEVVILLNQDTVAQPGWLVAILETFTDPTIGIVGCKALYPDGKTIQHAGALLEHPGAYPRHRGQGEPDMGQYDVMGDADYVTGAAFAMRRDVLDRLGYLDEAYTPAFYEEVDFCYRARRAGFRIIYQPQAIIYHYESTSLREFQDAQALAVHRNRVRFVLSHWSAEQLEIFWVAEQRKLNEIREPLLLEVLARAYFDDALAFPQIVLCRKTGDYLGGKLTFGPQHQALEMLYALSKQAGTQALQWIDSMSPSEETPGTYFSADLSATYVRPWAAWVNTDGGAEFFATSPSPPSRVPVAGPLITWLRGLWFTVMLRPYLAPVLGRLVLSFEYLHNENQSLQNQNRSLQRQNQSVQRQMDNRDIAISRALHSNLERLD